jgi:type IV fimbrial biogenesis protein FimT
MKIRQSGFTIIEVMVVVTIAAVMMALGVPSYRKLIDSNRASTAASALHASLNLARSEAIRRGASAKVYIAANTTADTWTNGWTVYVRASAADPAPTAADASATRIEVVTPQPDLTIAHSNTTVTYIMYNGDGRVATDTGATGKQTFWFEMGSSDRYCVIMSASGRPRRATVANGTTCSTD